MIKKILSLVIAICFLQNIHAQIQWPAITQNHQTMDPLVVGGECRG
jgi:hypothetical protein